MLKDATFGLEQAGIDLAAIAASDDPIYIVDRDFVIRAVNAAYLRFGKENGFPLVAERGAVGTDLAGVLPEPVADSFRTAVANALQESAPFDQDYECSSPELFRLFRLTAYPLADGSGLVVSHHLRLEEPHTQEGQPAGPAHLSPAGAVVQCCHCRKVRDWSRAGSWNWVPDFVRRPHPETSHSICENCLAHYYPEYPDDPD